MKAEIQSIQDLETAIESLLKQEKENVQADVATFHYYDEPNDRLILPIGLNLKDSLRFKSWLPNMNRIAGQIVKTGQPVVVDDAEHHTDTTGPFVYAENIKSSAGYPLITAAGKKIGVIFVSYREKHSFSPGQTAFLSQSATRMANKIDGWLTTTPS